MSSIKKYINFGVPLFFICIIGSILMSSAKIEASVGSGPTFSTPGGLYTEAFDLTLTTNQKNGQIYYTLDGSEPTLGEATTYLYTKPLKITQEPLRDARVFYFSGTVIRAAVIDEDGTTSEVVTNSYFVDPDIFTRYQLPIISITTEKDNLYDDSIGIMSRFNTQHRGKEWERPIHFEYFDPDGNRQISIDAGIRLHGGASRDWDFKSFRIYARNEYDETNYFEYDFFSGSVIPSIIRNGENEGNPVDRFKRLILRTGGNEGTAWDGTLMRDPFSQALMADMSLDLQAYQPAITFLNGVFYGIQNIRERQDDRYIEAHYNVEPEEVVIYEFHYDSEGQQSPVIVEGEEADLEFYQRIIDFMRNEDLSLDSNYEQMKEWVDIENFVDYQIMNIYGANRDWPGNNSKAWRYRTEEYNPDAPYGLDGRIRWLVYDMDFCFGLYDVNAVTMNSLADATKVGGTEWPLQDGATLMLRKLLENEEFKTYFIQRYLDLMNTNFDTDYAASLVDQMASGIETAIPEFRERYRAMGDWDHNLNVLKDFAAKRGANAKTHLSQKFDLGKFYFFTLNMIDSNGEPLGGSVKVNTVTIDHTAKGVKEGIWKKSYYENVPVVLTAIPAEGYEFVSWSGSSESAEPTIHSSELLNNGNQVSLTPIFRSIDNSTEVDNENNSTVDDKSNAVENSNIEKNDTMIYLLIIVLLCLIILIMFGYWFYQKRKEK